MPLNFGRYVVADEAADRLGQGAYGVVYRAFDPKLDRDVAIKVLRAEMRERSHDSGRFFREARALAALQHPGVVPVFDFGDEAGVFYLVLAFYSGGTLQGRLTERLDAGFGPFSAGETLALLEPICGGLAAAHELGMIHRDLKPANILLDAHDRPAISDFGLVHLVDDDAGSTVLTQSGDVMGTPAFMAPEQWEPELHAVTPSVDLYALGCIVHYLLTGHPPFQGKPPVLHARHLQAPPPRVTEARPDLPKAWDDAVQCLMAKDPAARFPTADAFLSWLKLALGDQTQPPPSFGGGPPVAPVAPAPSPSSGGPASTRDPADTLLGSETTIRSAPRPFASPGRLALAAGIIAAGVGAGWLWWPGRAGDESAPRPRSPELVSSGTAPITAKPDDPPIPASAGPVPLVAPATSEPAAQPPRAATNSLGQRFVSVALPGEAGAIDFGVWETRVQDFRPYAAELRDRRWVDPAAPALPTATPNWSEPGFPIADDHPVVFVSWEDASAWCRWLTAREHRAGMLAANLEYRLPIEAEWVAAAGAAAHPWGSEWPPPPASGNFLIQPEWNWDDGFAATAPVGTYNPNFAGIHDLAGNVREWCLDAFSGEPSTRAIRGGAYSTGSRAELRTSFRSGGPVASRNAHTGFRVVRAPVRPATSGR